MKPSFWRSLVSEGARQLAKAHKITGVTPLCSYHESACVILPQRIEEVYAWEPFVRDETRRKELHNLRISIKRLRYTMEFFRGTYRVSEANSQKTPLWDEARFAGFLTTIVDLQEILGDVHDCDVVLEVLADYKAGSISRAQQNAVFLGTDVLIARTEAARKAAYETFLRKWECLAAAGFKQKLLSFFGVAC